MGKKQYEHIALEPRLAVDYPLTLRALCDKKTLVVWLVKRKGDHTGYSFLGRIIYSANDTRFLFWATNNRVITISEMTEITQFMQHLEKG